MFIDFLRNNKKALFIILTEKTPSSKRSEGGGSSISFLVQWGEILVGLGLLLGRLTKTAVFFGIIINTAFLLSGTVSTNPNMILLSILILVAGHNAGRVGLDGFVFQKLSIKTKITIQPILHINSHHN
ncbi:hypothetical protein KOY_03777 [Bacillus cereus VDM021]|nr:hypothetical protein IIW_02266 [Bacillus cereus VD136]EOP67855.1 hypothetical protein KOW_03939 [Bacillus cereus VDM006]EOQ04322.1 hypothetical protein KOY_03777 [Bacillus cereus VDM021]